MDGIQNRFGLYAFFLGNGLLRAVNIINRFGIIVGPVVILS